MRGQRSKRLRQATNEYAPPPLYRLRVVVLVLPMPTNSDWGNYLKEGCWPRTTEGGNRRP